MLLQKVDDKSYVRDKIDLMYRQANISVPTNRLGLAKGMGLVCHKVPLLIVSLFFLQISLVSFYSSYPRMFSRLQLLTWIWS